MTSTQFAPENMFWSAGREFYGPNGMRYVWDATTMGGLQCIAYPSKTMVASYRYGMPGRMQIFEAGQPMETLLLATGWLADRLVLQNRFWNIASLAAIVAQPEVAYNSLRPFM